MTNESTTAENTATVGGSRLERIVSCEHCDDGEGGCAYPYYGLAPHLHGTGPGLPIGTHFTPRELWPDNFREDLDAPNHGTYTHCQHCGAGS